MLDKALPKVTADLEEQLGPCVLILRCYDLLGDRPAETQKLAEDIVLRELQSLSSIIRQAPTSTSMAEQFLRAIYSLQMAHRFSEAQLAFQRLVSAFRNAASGVPASDGVAFKIGVAMVILDQRDPTILDVLAEKSLPWRLVQAWLADNPGLLEEIFAEIEEAVIDQEDADRLHPWDDTWHYILLGRIQSRLECQGGATAR